jgi:hypothetical protein
MSYATSNPPQLLVPSMGGGVALWVYASTDAHGDVDGTDYFSNGDALGMNVNDIVIVNDTDTDTVTIHKVDAVTAGGAATLTAATLA